MGLTDCHICGCECDIDEANICEECHNGKHTEFCYCISCELQRQLWSCKCHCVGVKEESK